MFACDHAKVSPDLICLSKGITGGYMPFSAVLTTREIFDCFYADYQDMKAFLHSHSYTGNPLGACLAREAIRIFKQQKILEKIKPRIRQMRAGLREMDGLKWVANTRQTGLIGAFDIVQGNQKPFHWKRRMGWHIARAAVKRGALLRPLGDTLYFMPPLIISERELNRLFSLTRSAILDVLEG
jgi:adenosylmethionine-8-amino-7-oxononanoate aminotransferase